MSHRRLLCLTLALFCPCRAVGKPVRVPLTVKDWVGVHHVRSPVTSGIPLPMGRVKSVDRLGIATASGAAVSAQFHALAWWPDKSIRWVLCDFQADVAAGAVTRYFLVSQPTKPSASPLKVSQTKQAVTVDTGAMTFRVSKSKQTLVEQVTAGPRVKDIGFLGSAGAAPRKISVEQQGPMRVVVKIDGVWTPGLSYTARIHAFRGKSFLRVHLVLKNHGGNLALAELRLRTRLADAGKRSYTFGGPAKPKTGSLGKGDTASMDAAGAAQWCDLSGPAGGVTTAMMYFHENAPKAMQVSGDGSADLVLLPRQKGGKAHSFRGGLHKTHELFYYFHRPGATDAELNAAVAALRYPLHATAPNAWYRDTMAVPGIFLAVSDPSRWPRYERSVSGYNGWKPGRSPVRQGVGHWGRFGVKGWDDIDSSYGEVIQYLRHPDHPRGPLEAAKTFTRSSIDAKLMHRPGSHVYQTNYRAWQFEHFGVQGWLIYYCLTGEAYALEGARELAEGLRLRLPGWSQRAQGRAIKAFVSLFEVTGEVGYLDSAAQIVRRHRAGQGTRGEIGSLHAFAWQLAFIANGTGRYCLAARLAGRQDRTAEKFLTDLLDFFTENCWEPRPNSDGAMAYYWYNGGMPSNHGSDGKGGDQSFLFANGYAYAYALTGRKKYWEMAEKTGRHFRCTGNKNFHWRQGQAYLAQVQRPFVADDKTPPAVVTGLRAAWVSNYDIGLRWKQAADNRGVVGYRVYRGRNSNFTPGEQFVDREVADGARYSYKVTAVDAAGNEGPASEALAVSAAANVAPLMTAELGAYARAAAVRLIWRTGRREPDVVGVNVYRAAQPAAGFKKLASVPLKPYYLDSKVEMGKTYYYRITYVDGGGLESVPSNVVSAQPAAKNATVAVRVNLGGKPYTDKQGRLWQADAPTAVYKLLGKADTIATSKDIKGTSDDPLFQTARLSSKNVPSCALRFAIPNGRYNVTLLFGGIVRRQVAANVFDVYINGEEVLAGVDLGKNPGLFTAARKVIHDVNVLGGKLDVELRGRAGRCELSGIAVEGEAAAPATPPVPQTDWSRVLAINCGGAALTDAGGIQWRADQAVRAKPRKPHTSVYQSFLAPEPLHVATIKRVRLPGFGPPRPDIRTTLVAGKRLAYRVAVPNGTYRVRLYLVRQHGGGDSAGFDIVVENRRLPASRTSAAKGFVKTFTGVTVSDGDLTVELLAHFAHPHPPRLYGITLEKRVVRGGASP